MAFSLKALMRLGNNIQSVIQVHCAANSGAFKQVVTLNNAGNTFHPWKYIPSASFLNSARQILVIFVEFNCLWFLLLSKHLMIILYMWKQMPSRIVLNSTTTDKKERHQNLLETSCPFSNNRLSTQLLQIFVIHIVIIKHHKSPKTLRANSGILV